MKSVFVFLLFASPVHADFSSESGVEGLRAAYARKKGKVTVESESGVEGLRAAYSRTFGKVTLASESSVKDGSAAHAQAGAKVTPVQKVIQLLQGMLEKGKKEKHEEQVQFAAFKQFCDGTTVTKKRDIEEANEMIEMLEADIQKYEADTALLTKEIAQLDEDVAVWDGDIKAATGVRQIEKEDYDQTHADYSESIDALERAIAVLKKQAHDRKQADLIQVSKLKSLSLIPAKAKRAIDIFLAQDPDASLAETSAAVSAPEANAYEFQSQGIIDMLQKLLDKFVDERTTLEKEESESKHAFEMLKQSLNAQIEQASADRDGKAGLKSKKIQAKADATGQLQDTTSTRDDDSKYLSDLTATCEQKAGDFESRQQLRGEEIQAIEKAIEIISSGAVSGNAEKHLPGFLQTKKITLAQLRASDHSPAAERVAGYLKAQALELNSRVLSTLAMRVQTDPLKKVKKK